MSVGQFKEFPVSVEHKGSCKQQEAAETFTEENGKPDLVDLEGKLEVGYSAAHCSGGNQTRLESNWKWTMLGLMSRAVAGREDFSKTVAVEMGRKLA